MKNLASCYALVTVLLFAGISDVAAQSCVTAAVYFPGTPICPPFTALNVPFCAVSQSDANNQALNLVGNWTSQYSSNSTLSSNLATFCSSLEAGGPTSMAFACPGPNWFPADCDGLVCPVSTYCCASLQNALNGLCTASPSTTFSSNSIPSAFTSMFPTASGSCSSSGCSAFAPPAFPNPNSTVGLFNNWGATPWQSTLLAGGPMFGLPIFNPIPNCDATVQNTIGSYTFSAAFFGSVWEGSMLFHQTWTLGHSSLITSYFDIDDMYPAASISVTRPDAPVIPGSLYVRDSNGLLTIWSIGNTTVDGHWHTVVVIRQGSAYTAYLDGVNLPLMSSMSAVDATVMSSKTVTSYGTPARPAVLAGPFFGALANLTGTTNIIDMETASLLIPPWLMQLEAWTAPPVAPTDGTFMFNVMPVPGEIMSYGALRVLSRWNVTTFSVTLSCNLPVRVHAVDDVYPDGFLTTLPIPSGTIKTYPGDMVSSFYLNTSGSYIHLGTNGGYNSANGSWSNRSPPTDTVYQNQYGNSPMVINGSTAFYLTLHSWQDEIIAYGQWSANYFFSNTSSYPAPPSLNNTAETYDGFYRLLRLLNIPTNAAQTKTFKSSVSTWMISPINSTFNATNSITMNQLFGVPPSMNPQTPVGAASAPMTASLTGIGLIDTAASLNAMFANNGWCITWKTIMNIESQNAPFSCMANVNGFC